MFSKCPICEQEELAVAIFDVRLIQLNEIAVKVRCEICGFKGIRFFTIDHKSYETENDKSILELQLDWKLKVSMN